FPFLHRLLARLPLGGVLAGEIEERRRHGVDDMRVAIAGISLAMALRVDAKDLPGLLSRVADIHVSDYSFHLLHLPFLAGDESSGLRQPPWCRGGHGPLRRAGRPWRRVDVG